MNEITQPTPPRSFAQKCRDGIAAYRAEQQRLAPLKKEWREQAARIRREERIEAQRIAALTIVRTYQGRQRHIRREFARDAAALAKNGYVPVSQSATVGHGRKRHGSPFTAPKDQLIVTYHRDDPRAVNAAVEQVDVSAQLEQLASLHASGALSSEEFAAAKRRVLEGEASRQH